MRSASAMLEATSLMALRHKQLCEEQLHRSSANPDAVPRAFQELRELAARLVPYGVQIRTVDATHAEAAFAPESVAILQACQVSRRHFGNSFPTAICFG